MIEAMMLSAKSVVDIVSGQISQTAQLLMK